MAQRDSLATAATTTLVDAPGGRYTIDALQGTPAAAMARLKGGDGSPTLTAPITSEAFEQEIVDLVISRCKSRGVDFADLRLGRDHGRSVSVQDENLTQHHQSVSQGIGIRALVGGFWGFQATSDLTSQGVLAAADQAIDRAKAVAQVTPKELRLPMSSFAAEPAHRATFHTPVGACPFAAAVEDLARPFREAAQIARAKAGVKRVVGAIEIYGRRRIFASTDGAFIVTTHCVLDPWQRTIAVAKGSSAYRTSVGSAMAGGLEHFWHADFPGRAAAHADEALLKCGAPKVEPGRYNLILDGHNLALTMHESVGHPTELDRVLGYELGFAGGSFASLDKLRNFRYGSPLVNFTADNNIRFGGASVGYDDEGVACQKFSIIEEGILTGYGANRETAHRMGALRANGTTRSTHWYDAPIVRIPNLYLEPGKKPLSLQALISATDDGILMLGRDSFSIDQMRYNFQFGADMCYRIRGGKIAEPVKDVIYQSISPDFWGSMDAVCDASEWQMHGVFNCGKGQPMQAAKMMHGAAPARFQNIRVGF